MSGMKIEKNAFLAACEKIGWEAVVPKGSFFAWMKVPQNFTSTSFTELLLEKANVAVADGSGFGEYGEGYVRVGLLMDEDRLVEAVMRIETLNIFETATYSR